MHSTGIIVGAVALMSASITHASLSSSDWQGAGDQLLTIDSDTGLRWLDWGYTNGRSYNNISAQLGAGGEFEGFRYATEDEIRALYANAGAVTIAPIDGIDAANVPANLLLAGLLGTTFDGGAEAIFDLAGSNAMVETAIGDYGGSGPFHVATSFNYNVGQISPRWLNLSDATGADFVGSALVMVPAPSTLALFSTLGLVAFRRNR